MYVLKEYLHNLYHKYSAENPTKKISLSLFCRSRPKEVKLVKYAQKLSCLCFKHTNFVLKLKSLGIVLVESNPDRFVQTHVQQLLQQIEDRTVTMSEWKRVELENGYKKITLVTEEVAADDFKAKFCTEYTAFVRHTELVKNQYSMVQQLKGNINEQTCTVQMDFAENFVYKKFSQHISTKTRLHCIRW